MYKQHARILTLLGTLAFACGLSSVEAGFVTYRIGDGGLDWSLSGTMDSVSISGGTGGIAITRVTGGADLPAAYTTVCTDLGGNLYLGDSYQYDDPPVTFAGPPQQVGVNPKWGEVNTPTYLTGHSVDTGNATKAIENAARLFYTYPHLTTTGLSGTTEQKAALQMAVWLALYNTTELGTVDTTTTARRFLPNSSSPVVTDALSLLTAAHLDGSYTYTGFLLYPDPQTNQGNPGTEPPQGLLIPVPEPATFLAGALLLLPFGASTLRILRRKQVA